jgi:hypothetical protein
MFMRVCLLLLLPVLFAHAAGSAPVFEKTEARETIADLAAKLEAGYLDPAIGARYAAALRQKMNTGGYDGFASPQAFADAVTADLKAVHPDGHLALKLTSEAVKAQGHTPPKIVPFDPPRWVAPGVALATWRLFMGEDDSMAAARRMLTDFAGAHAIIFDMREHHGGGLDEQDVFFSQLFPKATHLVDMRIREGRGQGMAEAFDATPTLRRQPTANGVVTWQHWSTPAASQGDWAHVPVYVLTSHDTASAAEHFTLALKTTHRATIVGEVTRGAGNFGGTEQIGRQFTAFIAVGQTVDPQTGKGWDQVGIAPDIAVPAGQALDRALADLASKGGR